MLLQVNNGVSIRCDIIRLIVGTSIDVGFETLDTYTMNRTVLLGTLTLMLFLELYLATRT